MAKCNLQWLIHTYIHIHDFAHPLRKLHGTACSSGTNFAPKSVCCPAYGIGSDQALVLKALQNSAKTKSLDRSLLVQLFALSFQSCHAHCNGCPWAGRCQQVLSMFLTMKSVSVRWASSLTFQHNLGTHMLAFVCMFLYSSSTNLVQPLTA